MVPELAQVYEDIEGKRLGTLIDDDHIVHALSCVPIHLHF
jgi:hypothetical protein